MQTPVNDPRPAIAWFALFLAALAWFAASRASVAAAQAPPRPPDYTTTTEVWVEPSPDFGGVWDIHLQSYHPGPLICEVGWQCRPGVVCRGAVRIEAGAHRIYGTTTIPKMLPEDIERWCWAAMGGEG